MRERKEWHLTTCNRVQAVSFRPSAKGSHPLPASLRAGSAVASFVSLSPALFPNTATVVSGSRPSFADGPYRHFRRLTLGIAISPSRHFLVDIGLKVLSDSHYKGQGY